MGGGRLAGVVTPSWVWQSYTHILTLCFLTLSVCSSLDTINKRLTFSHISDVCFCGGVVGERVDDGVTFLWDGGERV